jgi:hypothetical protein
MRHTNIEKANLRGRKAPLSHVISKSEERENEALSVTSKTDLKNCHKTPHIEVFFTMYQR